MRTRPFVMVAALLLVSAAATAQDKTTGDAAAAQQDVPKTTVAAPVPDLPLANQLDFGLRGTLFGSNSDEARYQRYRDLRDGGTIDLFRFATGGDAYSLTLRGDHVGYRDQHFSGAYNNYGKVKATFDWNQTPLFYSDSTRSLYMSAAPGTLLLPDGIQSGIQNKTLTLVQAVALAPGLDTRSRRDVASFNLVYSATRSVDFNVTFRNTQKNGTQPYGAGFGFSDAIEVPLPIDHRTTEMGASLQWSNARGLIKLGYDGSFFRNNISTLTWDNPLRVSDSPTAGPAFGRMALSPNTDMNTASAVGALVLPGRSRATAYLAISNMTQNDPLIPFTTNTSLAAIPLDRATADLTARVVSMNYNFSSRPTDVLYFDARYRQYCFDNRSPEFAVGNTVNYDTSVGALNAVTELFGFTRRTFDGDASLTPFRFVAFRAGYTREDIDHANPSTGESARYVEKTGEDTLRASVDATGVGWLTLRGVYEHGKRTGSGLNLGELLAIGEQPSLRQFDVADRTRDSFRGILQVMPVSTFSVNASAGVGREDYSATSFGLRNNDNHVYSVGFDFVPVDAISFGGSYGYEKYSALQASRVANPLPAGGSLDDPTQQFNDPRRDWTDDSADTVHTWNASMDLLKVLPRTDVKVGYDYSRAQSTYVYGLTVDTTLAAPVPLPAVTNRLQRGTADVRYFFTPRFAVGMLYWFDKYDVDDFALGPRDSLASPATASATLMMLGYSYRPYTANTFMGRITYLW